MALSRMSWILVSRSHTSYISKTSLLESCKEITVSTIVVPVCEISCLLQCQSENLKDTTQDILWYYKNRFIEPVLIWWNITIVVKVVFQEILVLTKLQHIASKWFMTNLYHLDNGILLPISYTHYMWQQVTHSSVIFILIQPVRELTHAEIHVLITYFSRPLYKIYLIFLLSRWFTSAIISMYRQCLDVCLTMTRSV